MAVHEGSVWKVGELAELTGLTVRALHHYDHLGLVRPTARTPAGYRLYQDRDVERLYQVLALRQLGLPLVAIREALDGQARVGELLERHLAYLDRQLVAVRTLRAKVATVAAAAADGQTTSVTEFFALIREVITMDDTIKQYFSDEQLATLAERRSRLGEAALTDAQSAWSELIRRAQAAVDAGIDPSSAAAQRLAEEWMALLAQFHGDDEGLRESLNRMYADNAAQIQQTYGGPSQAVMKFIKAANAAHP